MHNTTKGSSMRRKAWLGFTLFLKKCDITRDQEFFIWLMGSLVLATVLTVVRAMLRIATIGAGDEVPPLGALLLFWPAVVILVLPILVFIPKLIYSIEVRRLTLAGYFGHVMGLLWAKSGTTQTYRIAGSQVLVKKTKWPSERVYSIYVSNGPSASSVRDNIIWVARMMNWKPLQDGCTLEAEGEDRIVFRDRPR